MPAKPQRPDAPAARQELAYRLGQQELVVGFGLFALGCDDLDALFDEASRLSARGMRTRFAKVLEYLPAQNKLLVRAGVGWAEGVVGHAVLDADDGSPAGYALHTKEAVIANDLVEERRFRTPRLLAEHGVRRAVNVIIPGALPPFGVLEVDSSNAGRFSAQDAAFLQGLANLLGVAIGRLRSDDARRAAEASLRELNESLERRVIERTAALRRSEAALQRAQRLEAIGKSAGIVAHDFNNILQAVIGYLSLLEGRVADDPTSTRFVAAALRASDRGERMSQQLLAFARRQPVKPERIDVNSLIAGMDELVRSTLGDAIAWRAGFAPDLPLVWADPSLLERALLNLVINARDATPDGGVVAIETAALELGPGDLDHGDEMAVGRYVRINIRDTGTGMPDEVRERAFEPFYSTKPSGAGTGLGLSMVYGFARQSKGRIRIDSAEGEGTVITLNLPVAEA